jgi:hypothetical protein
MVNKIAPDLLNQFIILYQNDAPPKTIIKATGIAQNTVYRLIRHMDFWGQPYAPEELFRPGRRQKKLGDSQVTVCACSRWLTVVLRGGLLKYRPQLWIV